MQGLSKLLIVGLPCLKRNHLLFLTFHRPTRVCSVVFVCSEKLVVPLTFHSHRTSILSCMERSWHSLASDIQSNIVGLIQYYFLVNMSQAMWILVDGSTIPLSWALTMGKPAKTLAPTRPTARLLGPETLASVIGQIIINLTFMIIAVGLLFGQSFFVCNEFDGRLGLFLFL
jgi:hypothetical protein